MGMYSAYSISQSAPVKWRPGEEIASSGFVGIVLYLFVDINVGIYRIFRKKQGLYYWTMLLGTWGCLLNTIAIILKYFVPNSEHLWILYTAFLMIGWTVFAPAQLLVLYSRLHLINQNRQHQRWIFIMIIIVSLLMIVPSWCFAWQAWNTHDKHLSAIYSPREAIFDRISQFGYTVAEGILSGVYISSLLKLLNLKSSVRQRRVMIDLIYVNIIVVCLDILTVILVFVNQVGISHPVQIFSYIIKFKLEFLVLNQLMAVAARGVQRENFAERRYHHPSTSSTLTDRNSRWGPNAAQGPPSKEDSVQELVIPEPTLSKAQSSPDSTGSPAQDDDAQHEKVPLKAKFKRRGHNKAGTEEAEDEDEEIGVHMWENRGNLVMEVPWFAKRSQA